MRKIKHNKGKIICFILSSNSIVPSLDVDGILHQEFFGNVLGPCIAVKG